MTFEIAAVALIVLGILLLLADTSIPPDAVLVAGLTAVLAVPVPTDEGWRVGLVGLEEGLAGFSNPGMLTVGVLFVVVSGLRETGSIDWIAARLLGRPRTERGAIARVMGPVWGMSAFLNNTPVVAMMIPAVQDWSRRLGLAPSRLMIPLSYAAILGGTCSLIGTSTNLVVAGLVLSQTDLPPMGMFDITRIGVPASLVGAAFLLLVGPKLLRDRRPLDGGTADSREYMLELVVPEGSPHANRSIESAGLRSLPGCFLVEIEREGQVYPAVGPEHVLRTGDLLLFAGVVSAIRDLANTRGLALASDQVSKLESPRFRRRLFEAVVAPTSALAGRTIREARFRTRFNGVVIAVARNGARLRGKIGDIRVRPGDLVLVESDPGFADRQAGTRDFLLVRPLEDSAPRRHGRAPVAIVVLVAMVALAALEVVPMLTAAMLAAAAMVMTRCCSVSEARGSVDWSVLIVIGAALGIGAALEATGAAHELAAGTLAVVGNSPWAALAAVYVLTSLLTEVVTNNAAVAILFPIAHSTASGLGVDFTPFVVAIMMAGSASFATPLGYQTNLMVYGPGGYRFTDFTRIGVPMNVVMGLATIGLAPLLFPFE